MQAGSRGLGYAPFVAASWMVARADKGSIRGGTAVVGYRCGGRELRTPPRVGRGTRLTLRAPRRREPPRGDPHAACPRTRAWPRHRVPRSARSASPPGAATPDLRSTARASRPARADVSCRLGVGSWRCYGPDRTTGHDSRESSRRHAFDRERLGRKFESVPHSQIIAKGSGARPPRVPVLEPLRDESDAHRASGIEPNHEP